MDVVICLGFFPNLVIMIRQCLFGKYLLLQPKFWVLGHYSLLLDRCCLKGLLGLLGPPGSIIIIIIATPTFATFIITVTTVIEQ